MRCHHPATLTGDDPDMRSIPTARPALLRSACIAGACVLLLAACAGREARDDVAADQAPVIELEPAQAPLDLPRFMGEWHVAAHIPWFGERGHVASSDTYTLGEDGEIQVSYRWRDGFGEPEQVKEMNAEVEPDTGNRIWKQKLFKVLPVQVRILEVAPDYSWALLDHPKRDMAWIMTRVPVIDAPTYRELEKKIAAHGVNTDKLRRVPQVPDQVGRLGFAPPNLP